MGINIVDKHPVKEFTAISHNNGINLCEKQSGSFLVIRYKEDLENLRALLDQLEITGEYKEAKA